MLSQGCEESESSLLRKKKGNQQNRLTSLSFYITIILFNAEQFKDKQLKYEQFASKQSEDKQFDRKQSKKEVPNAGIG